MDWDTSLPQIFWWNSASQVQDIISEVCILDLGMLIDCFDFPSSHHVPVNISYFPPTPLILIIICNATTDAVEGPIITFQGICIKTTVNQAWTLMN